MIPDDEENIIYYNNSQNKVFRNNPREYDLRVSQLKLYSPTVQLKGHKGELFAGKFSNEGLLFSTAGIDKQINIWDVFDSKCKNLLMLDGHTKAVLDFSWNNDDTLLASASADKNVFLWDIFKATRIKKLKGHTSIVNSVFFSKQDNNLLVSVSEDCAMIIWDLRTRKEALSFKHKCQLLTVVSGKHSREFFFAGIDNQIHCFNMKMNKIEYSLTGHSDTITGLGLSNDGNFICSNSMDKTVRVWNIKSFFSETRCLGVLTGNSNNFEKNLIRCAWSANDEYIAAGSADRSVYVWSVKTGELVNRLQGHEGTVNDVGFSKHGGIIGSVSSDFTAILGEFN